ncbi:Inner membrane protein YfdC [compost metagenome]
MLIGNVIGALAFAYAMLHLPIFDAQTDEAFLEIGRELMKNDSAQMLSKGMVSGWMIATMVWLVPAAENAKVWIILLVTYVMALGGFSHIVVGTCEAGYLVWAGEVDWKAYFIDFALPTLTGNIIGGSVIFALISHAQIRSDVS